MIRGPCRPLRPSRANSNPEPPKEAPMNTALQIESRQLEAAFQSVGLTLVAPAVAPSGQPSTRRLPTPSISGDERTDVDTIQETRRQRDW